MTAGSGTQRAGCVALPSPPLRCLKGSMTRLCQSMRDGGTALLTVMGPGPGLETHVHLPGSGALPLRARSCPPEPPGPKNCLLRPQHPTQCACSRARGSGGRPRLLGGPRKHTRGWRGAAKPGSDPWFILQLGRRQRPQRGARVLLTHTWGRREKPWMQSPFLTARGTLCESAWQQGPEARSVCLVPDR